MRLQIKILAILLLVFAGTAYGQKKKSDSIFHRAMLFKWADTLDINAQSKILELFKGMPNKIDGFESIEINKISKSDEGFDHAFILKFKTKKGLETYEKYPDHLRIQELAPPLVRGFLLYEYWRKTEN